MKPQTVAPKDFRATLSNYPTGVCVITTVDGEEAVAMTIGSFSSISLTPPIVGFFVDKDSRRLPYFIRSRRFCANVLGAAQTDVCRHFARETQGQPSHFELQRSPSGLPLIKGAIAWIDCEIHDLIDIGDHTLIVGQVNDLWHDSQNAPLVFVRGQFGHVSVDFHP